MPRGRAKVAWASRPLNAGQGGSSLGAGRTSARGSPAAGCCAGRCVRHVPKLRWLEPWRGCAGPVWRAGRTSAPRGPGRAGGPRGTSSPAEAWNAASRREQASQARVRGGVPRGQTSAPSRDCGAPFGGRTVVARARRPARPGRSAEAELSAEAVGRPSGCARTRRTPGRAAACSSCAGCRSRTSPCWRR